MNISHKSIYTSLICLLFAFQGMAQVNLTFTDTRVPSNDKEVKELTHSFFTHLLKGNIEEAANMLDSKFENYGSEQGPQDKAKFLDMWKNYHETSTDAGIKEGGLMAFEVLEGPNKGVYASVYGLMTWTPKATQKPVNIWGHMMIKVEEGKIVQIYDFQDNLSTVMQMGYTLTPPSTGE